MQNLGDVLHVWSHFFFVLVMILLITYSMREKMSTCKVYSRANCRPPPPPPNRNTNME